MPVGAPTGSLRPRSTCLRALGNGVRHHSNLSCQIDLSAIIAVTDLISPTPPILTGIGTLAWQPRKRSAAPANTTVVCRVRRRGIDMVLRCAAKPNTPPSTRRHHVLSNDLQGLVWDMDADTPLGRALQNECATRPCVAERTAAREFAAAKTTLNLPMAAATKARLYTRRVPGPRSSLCAKTRARLYTRGMSGPGSSLSSSTCPNPFFVLALGLCTEANSHQEKWGQAPLRSTLRDSIARAHAVVVLDQN